MHVNDYIFDAVQVSYVLIGLEVMVQIVLSPRRKNIGKPVTIEVIYMNIYCP